MGNWNELFLSFKFFPEAVSSSHYPAPNIWMIKIGKVAQGSNRGTVLSWYLLGRTEDNQKNLSG
jgi:hypothetical protein